MPFQWPLGLKKSLKLSITADCCDVIFECSGNLIPMLIIPRISRFSKRFLVACTLVTLPMAWWCLKSEHVMPYFTEHPPKVKVAALMASHLELPEQQLYRSWGKISSRQLLDSAGPVGLHDRCEVARKAHDVEADLLISFKRFWKNIVVRDIRAGWCVVVIVILTHIVLVFHDHCQLLHLSAFRARSCSGTPLKPLICKFKSKSWSKHSMKIVAIEFKMAQSLSVQHFNPVHVIESTIPACSCIEIFEHSESNSSTSYWSSNMRPAASLEASQPSPCTTGGGTGLSVCVSWPSSAMPCRLIALKKKNDSERSMYIATHTNFSELGDYGIDNLPHTTSKLQRPMTFSCPIFLPRFFAPAHFPYPSSQLSTLVKCNGPAKTTSSCP